VVDPLSLVKPAVRAQELYTLPPRTAAVKVDQNENPFELPDAFKAEVLRRLAAAPWGRYPEFVPRPLLEALARHSGWRPDGALAGNGSNELIDVVLKTTVGPGVRVVIPEPTFTLYANMAATLGAHVVRVPLRADLSYDVEALLAADPERRGVLIVCSPNNPTGTAMSEADLRRLLASWRGLVVLDEAYQEFTRGVGVALLAEHRHLVVLRTFSKAMALAGLRVGYLLGDPALVRELDKVKLPYNLNRFSVEAATLALERYDEVLRPSVERLVALREALARDLAAIPGLRVVPSSANFLLVRCAWPPRAVHAALFERGVLARDVSRYPMLGDALRIGVGTAEENARTVEGLQAFSRARGADAPAGVDR
jgi:histidinol-phosphate aminotransferase